MTDPEAALAGEGLSVRRGRTEILHDVSVSVAAGEIVAVLGPNGAGKSTLLATLDGSLTPAAGQVHRHGRTAMLMQSPGLARRSARANVEVAMAWWGVPRRHRRAGATAALERMRAGHLAGRPAQQLSGGEQRRVHLARAIAVAPDVLLLDEPFDGLDPHTHADLRDDTAQALRDADSAAVVVLHDRADAWAMADRLVVLIDGRVHASGAPHDVLDRPPTAEVARFLGYDGELSTGHGVLLTRATHVRLAPAGEFTGRVTRVVVIEDGLRVRLETERGYVWGVHSPGPLHLGDALRFHVDGGAEFGP